MKRCRQVFLTTVTIVLLFSWLYINSTFCPEKNWVRKVNEETDAEPTGLQRTQTKEEKLDTTILYVIRTHPNNFQTKLAEQASTWLKGVDKSQVLITSSKNIVSNVNNTMGHLQDQQLPKLIDGSEVLFSDCPGGHDEGPACTEANGLAKAYYTLIQGRTKFNWVFVIDDDVLVFPQKLSQVLKTKDMNLVHGVPGCVVDISKSDVSAIKTTGDKESIAKGKISGLCGGGGYAISSHVLQKLFAKFKSKSEFYETYMSVNKLTHFCDITTSHLLSKYANASIVQLEGIHPWAITEGLEQYLSKKGNFPILTLHYSSGNMQKYIDIVNNHHKLKEKE